MNNLNKLVLLLLLLLTSLVAQPTVYKKDFVAYAQYLDKDTLYVFSGFDGSYNPQRWAEILAFGKAQGVKFTFFISGVYLIPNAEKQTYTYPVNPLQTGVSAIGFGGTGQEVETRKNWMRQALKEGHDIQSHLNCHIAGHTWTQAAWGLEFKQFGSIAATIPATANHLRFPELVYNQNVYPVMAKYGYKSILSVIQPQWKGFNKIVFTYNNTPYTILEFPIPMSSKGIMMDWNIDAYDQKHKISSAEAEEYVYELYMQEAAKCLAEHRPLFLSHHFSSYNNGAHWRAMQRALISVKAKYKVKYVTINDIYNLVNK